MHCVTIPDFFIYINISAALMGLYSITGGFIYVRFFPGCVQQDKEIRK